MTAVTRLCSACHTPIKVGDVALSIRRDPFGKNDEWLDYHQSCAPIRRRDGFADQVWGLSMLAQAELDNGDLKGVQKTLVRIAEVAAAKTNR